MISRGSNEMETRSYILCQQHFKSIAVLASKHRWMRLLNKLSVHSGAFAEPTLRADLESQWLSIPTGPIVLAVSGTRGDTHGDRAVESNVASHVARGIDALAAPTKLLNEFVGAAEVRARREALIGLIKCRQLHSIASDESFRNGLEWLARSARDSESETDRLLTVAALLHAAATAPSIRNHVKSLLRKSIDGPLSKLHELQEVRERLYAAKSWRIVPDAWCVDDLATAAAHEESGEAVRKECIEGIFELTGDLAEAIGVLGSALLGVKFDTKKPSDSLGRRLNRVLVASTEVISRSNKPVGENAGRELSRLLDGGFRTIGHPASPAVRSAVAKQAAAVTHAIVRADFSHAGRAETYGALLVVKNWFGSYEWQELCVSSDSISRVRDDVRKALLFLASAGKTDEFLRLALATVAGSSERADSICLTIATEQPGIPDAVRDWLAGVPKRNQSHSVVESQERSIDEVLAELLIAMTRLSRASETVQSDVLPDVSIVLPQSEYALSQLTGMADAMASKLSLVVEWRSLRIRGTAGEEVDFSPLEHLVSSSGAPTRRVRLLSPVVERVSEDGVPRVVLKAAVEPVSDQGEFPGGGDE